MVKITKHSVIAYSNIPMAMVSMEFSDKTKIIVHPYRYFGHLIRNRRNIHFNYSREKVRGLYPDKKVDEKSLVDYFAEARKLLKEVSEKQDKPFDLDSLDLLVEELGKNQVPQY